MGALSAPVYGESGSAQLPLGESLEMSAIPVEDNGLSIRASAFAVEGFTDSGKGTPASDVCSVDENGRVSAESQAAEDNVCEVTVTMSALGYEDKNAAVVDLVLVEGTLIFNTPPHHGLWGLFDHWREYCPEL